MQHVITDISQVTPQWLTEVLQNAEVLPQGRVTAIEHQGLRQTVTAAIVRLAVQYSADAAPSAPNHFILKMAKPELSDLLAPLGQHEVIFYQTIAPAMSEPPVVACYDAAYTPGTRQFHLLLEDLSETHEQTEWPLPPSIERCQQSVDCLARFHAHWWDHPHLGTEVGTLSTEDALQDFIEELAQHIREFVQFLGDRLSAERRTLYDRVVRLLPRLWGQRAHHDLTLIHLDAHTWNFLYPRDAASGEVRLIDWQGWEIGSGVTDLAYMMALHWYPERRAALEQPLLQRYHEGLQALGVQDYDWTSCWHDYRLAVTRNLVVPAWQWSAKLPAMIWWPHLERSMLAFEDLTCSEFLEP